MKRLEDGLRKVIKSPLESIGYILATALVLIGLYLFSPFFQTSNGGEISLLGQYGVGLFYIVMGVPYLIHSWVKCPRWISRSSTNLMFTGYFFTTLFILISTGLRPPHFMWAAAGLGTSLVVHLWVARRV